MIDFIVSGRVPGIHLQITFLLWELSVIGFLAFAAVRIARRVGIKHSSFGAADDDTQTV